MMKAWDANEMGTFKSSLGSFTVNMSAVVDDSLAAHGLTTGKLSKIAGPLGMVSAVGNAAIQVGELEFKGDVRTKRDQQGRIIVDTPLALATGLYSGTLGTSAAMYLGAPAGPAGVAGVAVAVVAADLAVKKTTELNNFLDRYETDGIYDKEAGRFSPDLNGKSTARALASQQYPQFINPQTGKVDLDREGENPNRYAAHLAQRINAQEEVLDGKTSVVGRRYRPMSSVGQEYDARRELEVSDAAYAEVKTLQNERVIKNFLDNSPTLHQHNLKDWQLINDNGQIIAVAANRSFDSHASAAFEAEKFNRDVLKLNVSTHNGMQDGIPVGMQTKKLGDKYFITLHEKDLQVTRATHGTTETRHAIEQADSKFVRNQSEKLLSVLTINNKEMAKHISDAEGGYEKLRGQKMPDIFITEPDGKRIVDAKSGKEVTLTTVRENLEATFAQQSAKLKDLENQSRELSRKMVTTIGYKEAVPDQLATLHKEIAAQKETIFPLQLQLESLRNQEMNAKLNFYNKAAGQYVSEVDAHAALDQNQLRTLIPLAKNVQKSSEHFMEVNRQLENHESLDVTERIQALTQLLVESKNLATQQVALVEAQKQFPKQAITNPQEELAALLTITMDIDKGRMETEINVVDGKFKTALTIINDNNAQRIEALAAELQKKNIAHEKTKNSITLDLDDIKNVLPSYTNAFLLLSGDNPNKPDPEPFDPNSAKKPTLVPRGIFTHRRQISLIIGVQLRGHMYSREWRSQNRDLLAAL